MSEHTRSPTTTVPIASKSTKTKTAASIWRRADSLLHQRLHEGHAARPNGQPLDVMREARLAQLGFLDTSATDGWPAEEVTSQRLALLVLEMPEAGHAQRMLDTSDAYGAERNKDYVATLSEFNNDLTSTLAHMPEDMVDALPSQLMARNAIIQGKEHAPSMTEEDLYRSLRGVKREVAFWRALHNNLPRGWHMRHSTTEEDLHGSDFVIEDPEGRTLRLDVKARERFNTTLIRLASQGWISRGDARRGVREGFVYKPNTDNTGRRDGTFSCVFDADNLGQISHYRYDNPDRVRRFVEARMQDRHVAAARKLGRVGRSGAQLLYSSRGRQPLPAAVRI